MRHQVNYKNVNELWTCAYYVPLVKNKKLAKFKIEVLQVQKNLCKIFCWAWNFFVNKCHSLKPDARLNMVIYLWTYLSISFIKFIVELLQFDLHILFQDLKQQSPYSLSPLSLSSQRLLRSPHKATRKISRIPFKVLDAPELQDDFYLNLVDWSMQNVLSVGLGSCVYLWSACTSQVKQN